jgi:hypothetical protein
MKKAKTYIAIFITASIIFALSMGYINRAQNPPIPIQIESIEPKIVVLESPKPIVSKMKQAITANQVNPDASYNLRLISKNEGDYFSYSLSYSKKDADTENTIYTETFNENTKLSIPFNTWSPDNKYVFLKSEDSVLTDYLVYKITDNQAKNPIRITKIFREKYQDYVIKDVTGWAAPSLLILVTTNSSDEVGPSFWFNVTSQTFTQLSTKF